MIGRLRLISGLILFVFVLGHFSNHALGIISLKAMSDALWYTIEPWRSLPGTVILLGALSVHVVLAFWAIHQRKTFHMRSWEAVQIILGLLIPVLVASHVLATRGTFEVFGLEEGYAFHIYTLWIASPYRGIINAITLLVVWVHACIGWHYWLRLKPWYPPLRIYAYSFALLAPALALAGYLSAGYRVLRLSNSEKWVDRLRGKFNANAEEITGFILGNEQIIQLTVLVAVLLVVSIHFIRTAINARPGSERLAYRNFEVDKNESLNLQPKLSVLDLLRSAKIPHASVCGGRGRCSTCRVRIDDGLEDLPEPSDDELRVLARISAPPNVRLACQLVPEKSLSVTALLKHDASVRQGFAQSRNHEGEELEIAVLFADIRAFTQLSETRLPYDTAFLLNRYFAAMGGAIEAAGGHLDKFIGDGVMALFGVDKTLEEGCREALKAAQMMGEKLEELNKNLEGELPEPLRIGIGIHSGSAIVGNMGYNQATGLTAIGDIVNTSSRLEGTTKEFGVQLVVSDTTVEKSGFDLGSFPQHQISIRGRNEPLAVRAIEFANRMNL